MRYLQYYKLYNEKLTHDEVAECLIELIDMGYDFTIRKNEPYNYANVCLKKKITGKYTHSQVFRCIVNRENIGCNRNIIGWRNSNETELNEEEKITISKAINAAEKLLMAEDEIKQIKVEAEYYDIMDQVTHLISNCYYIILYVSKK